MLAAASSLHSQPSTFPIRKMQRCATTSDLKLSRWTRVLLDLELFRKSYSRPSFAETGFACHVTCPWLVNSHLAADHDSVHPNSTVSKRRQKTAEDRAGAASLRACHGVAGSWAASWRQRRRCLLTRMLPRVFSGHDMDQKSLLTRRCRSLRSPASRSLHRKSTLPAWDTFRALRTL